MVYCMFAAMGFVIGASRWILYVSTLPEGAVPPSLWRVIGGVQIRAFLGVVCLSCANAAYETYVLDDPVSVVGEMVVLCVAVGGAVVLARVRGGSVSGGVWCGVKRVFLVFCAIFVGWIMTIAVGFLVWSFLLLIGVRDPVVPVLLAGASWFVPVLGLYYRLGRERRKAIRVYRILQPLLLAYLVLLFPLYIQQLSHSEKWQRMLHAKRPPRLAVLHSGDFAHKGGIV